MKHAKRYYREGRKIENRGLASLMYINRKVAHMTRVGIGGEIDEITGAATPKWRADELRRERKAKR